MIKIDIATLHICITTLYAEYTYIYMFVYNMFMLKVYNKTWYIFKFLYDVINLLCEMNIYLKL